MVLNDLEWTDTFGNPMHNFGPIDSVSQFMVMQGVHTLSLFRYAGGVKMLSFLFL